MEQNKKIGYKDIFKQKEYMKMMVAALINRFGDSIDAIASTWIVYELTGSAVWSAVIFGVNKVPSVFVTPLHQNRLFRKEKSVGFLKLITELVSRCQHFPYLSKIRYTIILMMVLVS